MKFNSVFMQMVFIILQIWYVFSVFVCTQNGFVKHKYKIKFILSVDYAEQTKQRKRMKIPKINKIN